MKDIVYFIVKDNGSRIQGCIKYTEIERALRTKDKTVTIYSREFVMKLDWNLIKQSGGVKEYIEKYLPEYMI